MATKLYKDAKPAETITRIKSILSQNGIAVTENAMQGINGVYSVRLLINDIALGTNGKGLTLEAAQASAYAELVERLQNFALYKFIYPAKDKRSDLPFYYAPDEIAVTYEEFTKLIPLLDPTVDLTNVTVEDLTAINTDHEKKNRVVLCIPYQKHFSKESALVPARLCEHIFASNGMSAGNTYTEALVQGICEIFERYANQVIFEGKVVPPDIDISHLNFSEEMIGILSGIMSNSNYVIKFKDCSLGMSLPVVGMYIIDKSAGKYFIKFGCHPIISVAAERTITELFQGRSLSNANQWLRQFSFETKTDETINFERIFRSGDGTYPYTFFSGNNSYSFSDCWCKKEHSNNEYFLSFLSDILAKNGWELFHRDVSFLGFPSLHAFIPGISNIYQINNTYLSRQKRFSQVKLLARRIELCSSDELSEIVSFIDSNSYTDFDNIRPLLNLPLGNKASFGNSNNLFFKFQLCNRANKHKEGLHYLDKFIKECLYKPDEIVFYQCIREAYYASSILKLDSTCVDEYLAKVFAPQIVDAVKQVLNRTFPIYNCFNCEQCLSKTDCAYPSIFKLDDKISKQYLLWKNGMP